MPKQRMPRVYLLRHGETEWTINGRHTGVSDIPLTKNGKRIVKEMGPRVVGPGPTLGKERSASLISSVLINPTELRHVIISPRQRAQVTAKLLFGDDPPEKCYFQTDPDVAEWDYGAYEGMLSRDIKKEKPDWSIWDDGCPPGETPGETPQQMSDRVDRVIGKVREIHAKAEQSAPSPEEVDHSDVIIVSHGHFSRVFIARWCNLPLQAGYHFAADAGGLAVLGYQHYTLKEPSLLGLNWYTEESLNGGGPKP